ncbi:hypothetical protein [Streptomyces sp. NPDC001292]|uniref:hypothetical protein n=1 Tax=Streptomyces sp. NPDC001292 TaxID=3364558 RepID=UPI0036B8ED3C
MTTPEAKSTGPAREKAAILQQNPAVLLGEALQGLRQTGQCNLGFLFCRERHSGHAAEPVAGQHATHDPSDAAWSRVCVR